MVAKMEYVKKSVSACEGKNVISVKIHFPVCPIWKVVHPGWGVFGYHARSRREYGSLAAAAGGEERGVAKKWRRGKRVEQRTERPQPVGCGRAGDDPLRGGSSRRRRAQRKPSSIVITIRLVLFFTVFGSEF